MSTDILESPVVETTDTGEPGKEAHIVRKEDANRGYIGQEPIEALCGKMWIPSRNPENLPICPKCQEEMKKILLSDSN